MRFCSARSLAHYLQKNEEYEITIFEKNDRIGGHTATVDVSHEGRDYAVDTGFIVFNDWTYPNFIRLMEELGVESQSTDMGFSLSCSDTGLEYSGTNISTLFAQKRNIFNLGHWSMIRDIVRFNKAALQDADNPHLDSNMRLGDYLKQGGYGERFRRFYLIPMASAIWSSSLDDVENMPLQFFVRFFKNHGLLSVNDRPQWRVIKGGSRAYLHPLTESFKDRIRLSCSVSNVCRENSGGNRSVLIDSAYQEGEQFDEVIFACHSDQALKLLADPSEQEWVTLQAIPYSENEVVLHTDEKLLPKRRKAWSSWNYLLGRSRDKAVLTYDMNILQGIESDTTFCVTLNDKGSIEPDKIIGVYQYAHPEFSTEGILAQKQLDQFNGSNSTWFCGAWCGNGFHEDGVLSAVKIAQAMGALNSPDQANENAA